MSALSSTGSVVDTIDKLCKLRDTSVAPVLYFTDNRVFVNSTYDVVVDVQFH